MSALAMLHHLRIERVLWGEQKGLTWPTGSARSRKLFFDAIRMHYGSIVMLQRRFSQASNSSNYSKFTGSTSRNIIYLAFSMDYGSRGKIMEFTRNIST